MICLCRLGSRYCLGPIAGLAFWPGNSGWNRGWIDCRPRPDTMASMLFEVKSTDPIHFCAVAVLLCGIELIACYLPARMRRQH